jgi:hypothetical protein
MATRPLGDFNIPSPEMPSSEGEGLSTFQPFMLISDDCQFF